MDEVYDAFTDDEKCLFTELKNEFGKKCFGDNYHIAAFEYLIFVFELGGRTFRKHVKSLKDEREKTLLKKIRKEKKLLCKGS